MTTADIDLFAPAQMTRQEIAVYNRQIAHPAGFHLCPGCKRTLPRTSDNFYHTVSTDGYPRWQNLCFDCNRAYKAGWYKQRYATNEEFRTMHQERSRQYYLTLTPHGRHVLRLKKRITYAANQRERRRKPFDVTTIGAINLTALSVQDVIWANEFLKDSGRRICQACRQVKPLDREHFRYARRSRKRKKLFKRVCIECQRLGGE